MEVQIGEDDNLIVYIENKLEYTQYCEKFNMPALFE